MDAISFSIKKIYPRLNENQRYLEYFDKVKEKYHQMRNKKQAKTERKSYTFLSARIVIKSSVRLEEKDEYA